MYRIQNPYNIVAFYDSRTEASKHCPIYAPPTGIPFQFRYEGAVASFGASFVNAETGEPYGILTTPPVFEQDCEGTDTYLTYNTGGLMAPLPEGCYYLSLSINNGSENLEFFSNKICVENSFLSQSWSGDDACSGAPPGDWSLTVSFLGTTYGVTSVEADLGTGYVYKGSTSGQVDQDDFSGSGVKTVNWRLTTNLGGYTFYRVYYMIFNMSDPCGTKTFNLVEVGGNGVDGAALLEFKHSTDLQPMNLLYQEGYVQRFYFKPEMAFPTPVEEFTFITNGKNEQVFESASILEQINFDVHPVPDYLLTVLAAVRAHDTVTLKYISDSHSLSPVNLQIAPRTTQGDLCSTVRFSFEANRAFIPGCTEDYVLKVC